MKTATRSHSMLMKVDVICSTNAYSQTRSLKNKKLLKVTEPTTKIVLKIFGDLSAMVGFLHMKTMMFYHIFEYIFIDNAFDEYMSHKIITQLKKQMMLYVDPIVDFLDISNVI